MKVDDTAIAAERGAASSARCDRSGEPVTGRPPSDAELLELFERDPTRAWELFIDKHANTILGFLRRLGFRGDEAMDRFVYVCEKLVEHDSRRLRSIGHLGRSGELTPWLFAVVRNLSINWAVSRVGRRRLLKPIARLGELERAVFELYFWRGLMPSEICELLRAEGAHRLEGNAQVPELRLVDVLDSLDRIFEQLSSKKVWRLVSSLRRSRPEATRSLEEDGARGLGVAHPGERQDRALMRSERASRLRSALAALTPHQRLVVLLRYEEGLSYRQLGRVLGLSERQAARNHQSAVRRLRRLLEDDGLSVE